MTRVTPLAGVLALTGCGDLDKTMNTVVKLPGQVVSDVRRSVTRLTENSPRPASQPRPAARTNPQFAAATPVAPSPQAPPSAAPPATAPPHTVPPVQVNGLRGQAVRALLGQPTVQSGQAPGETWTYRSGPCEVNLYLFPDVAHGGMRVLDHRIVGDDGAPNREQSCLNRLRQHPDG